MILNIQQRESLLNQEPVEVKGFTITENRGEKRTIDISPGVVDFRFYENVLSAYITATAIVINTGTEYKEDAAIATRGLIDGLPIRGGEKVSINVDDSKRARNTTLLQTFNAGTINFDMVVLRIENVITDRGRELFTLHLVSPEYFTNYLTAVQGRYQGLIHDHVHNIMNNIIRTPKMIWSDRTVINYNFYGNGRKPFPTLLWLASKGIPEITASGKGGSGVGGAAGYLFYETRKGFNFRSIDKMFMANSSGFSQVQRKFLFNDTGLTPEGYDFNIMQFSVDTNMNLEDKLLMGTYANNSVFFDLYTMTKTDRPYNYGTDAEGKLQEAGDDPIYDHLPSDIRSTASKTYTHLLDIGVNPDGIGNEQLEGKNQDPGWYAKQRQAAENAMVQTVMRYNQLFTVQINATIPADFALKAGDLVECNFKDTSGSSSPELNTDSSGIYMIGSVCHRYSPEDKGGYTQLGLIRDTFGRKLDT